MKLMLLDEQGSELTEVVSHFGRLPGQVVVDWATRPDALFRHYFDRGGRTVTAVMGAAKWSAVLGTRWQMGARGWFLHELKLIHPRSEDAGHARAPRDVAGGAGNTRHPRSGRARATVGLGSRASLNHGRGGSGS